MGNAKVRRVIHSALAASLIGIAVPQAPAEGASATVQQAEQRTNSPNETSAAAAVTTDSGKQETKITREEAIEIARKVAGAAGNVEGYKGPEVSLRNENFSPYERYDIWEVSWRKEGPDFSYIEVAVDANSGLVRGIRKGSSGREAKISFPPKVRYEQAAETANEFVQKIYGENAERFQYDRREGEDWGKVIRQPHDSYEVRFVEMVNGVPFPRNSISVGVDGNGEIAHLRYDSVDGATFADRRGILSKEQILAKLERQLEMRLALEPRAERPGEEKATAQAYFSYVPEVRLYQIDAKTGEVIDYLGNVQKLSQTEDKPLAEKAQAAPPGNRAKPLTQEEALQRVESLMNIPQDVTIRSIELEEQGTQGKKVWQMMFEYRYRNGAMGWPGAVVDAETGEIVRLSLLPYLQEKYAEEREETDEKTNEPISYEQAKEKAVAFIMQHSKDKLHELYLAGGEPRYVDPYFPAFHFNFERRVNGILIPQDRLTITVSAETGEVVDFYQNWRRDLSLPEKPARMLTPEQAREIYLRNLDFTLQYQIFDEKPFRLRGLREKSKEPLQARLVYRVEPKWRRPHFIDAATGKLLDPQTGAPVDSVKDEKGARDVKGHWAERELTYLLQMQVIAAREGKVKPDEIISRGEFVRMLGALLEGPQVSYSYRAGDLTATFADVPKESEYFPVVEWAARRGILEKETRFRPDDPITREEAAVLIINALGYDKLAATDGWFQLPFTDKEQIDHPGPVALVNAIGIMKGDGTRFHPDRPLTRAQAAVAVFRFMEKRAEFRPEGI
ncbi:hypothetical protein BSNK01_31340 [Bacillaceae bacterium]